MSTINLKTVFHFTQKFGPVTRYLERAVFRKVPGSVSGSSRVYADDNIVIKVPKSKEEQALRPGWDESYFIPPVEIFGNYAEVEQRAGRLAVPFVTVPAVTVNLEQGSQVVESYVVVQEKLPDSAFLFPKVIDYISALNARAIKQLIDMQLAHLKALVRHGVFMADPNFWNYGLIGGLREGRLVSFDFDWIFCSPEAVGLQMRLADSSNISRTAEVTFVHPFIEKIGRGETYLTANQKELLTEACRYYVKGYKALMNINLLKQWGITRTPVLSPFADCGSGIEN